MVVGWAPNLTSTKYEQTATLLRQGYDPNEPVREVGDETPRVPIIKQDPITGEIIREWVEAPTDEEDDPETPINESHFNFECQARGIMTGGLNVRGTMERWTSKGFYDLTESVEMHVAPNIHITDRDRVTNIRNSRGEIVWREESSGSMRPTVFDVAGVQPSLDPFGSLVEWFVLLQRSEVQGGKEGVTDG